jgi:hypothetical protein
MLGWEYDTQEELWERERERESEWNLVSGWHSKIRRQVMYFKVTPRGVRVTNFAVIKSSITYSKFVGSLSFLALKSSDSADITSKVYCTLFKA